MHVQPEDLLVARFDATRRDFLKLMSASLGCALLTSCGGSGGGTASGGGGAVVGASTPGPPLPNGYRFIPIYTPGQLGLNVATLTPQVVIDESNHVFFFARAADSSFSLTELTLDYTLSTPAVVDYRVVMAEGLVTSDGRIVSQLVSADVDESGNLAAVVNYDISQGPAGQGPASVFVDQGQGLEMIVDYGTDIPGNMGSYGGDFGDVDYQNGDVLLVARYGGDGSTGQGVFYLPGATNNAAQMVLNSGQEVPGADGNIENIGLIDLDDQGEYVVQAFGSSPYNVPTATGSSVRGSVILHANVNSPISQARLLAASPSLQLTRSTADTTTSVGESFFGPRIAGPNITSHITEDASGNVTLYRNGVAIAGSGLTSPGGSLIQGVLSAVINGSGLAFYEVVTDAGIEVCVSNGLSAATILSRGAVIGSSTVDTVILGFHTTQVDDNGRLVCYVQMANGQEAVLLGIPV